MTDWFSEVVGDTAKPKAAPAASGTDWFGEVTGAAKPAPEEGAAPQRPKSDLMAQPAGFNRGLAQVLGLPVDLVTAALNFVGADIKEPFGGTESIRRGMEGLGVDTSTEGSSFLGRVGSEAMEAMGGAAAGFGAGKAAQLGLKAAGPVTQEVLRAVTSNPGQQMVASAASGVGGGLAEELAPGNVTAELAGRIGGGLVGAGIISPLLEAGKEAVAQAIKPWFEQGRKSIVGNVLSRVGGDDLDMRLAAPPARAGVPGSKLTTAQETLDPGMAAAEQAMRNDSKIGAQFKALDAQQQAARTQALEGLTDQTPGSGGQIISDAVKGRLDQFETRTNALIQSAQERVQQRLAKLGPNVSREEAGKVIREEIDRARLSAETLRDRAALPLLDQALDSGAVVNAKPVLRKIDGMLARDKRTAVVNALNEARSKLFRPGTEELDDSVGGLYETRKAINDIIAGKGDKPEARYAKRELLEIREALDRQISAAEPTFGKYIKKYASESQKRTARFEQPETGAVLKTDQYGEAFTMPAERVFERYWRSGGNDASAAQEFKTVIGKRGDETYRNAMGAMKQRAATELRDFALNADDTVDPKRWARWMQDHAAPLREFPELRKAFGNVKAAQDTVDSLAARQERTLGEVRKGVAAYFLKQNPDDAVASVLNSKNSEALLDDLLSLTKKNPDALPGLRRAFIDQALGKAKTTGINQANEPVLSNAGLIKFLDDHPKEAAKLFDKDHLATLRAVAEDAQRSQFSQTGAKVAGSNTVQNLVVGNLINRASLGLLGEQSPFPNTALRPLRWLYQMPETHVQELLVDALMDPQVARTMRAQASPANTARLSRLLKDRLATTLGLSAVQQQAPELEMPILQEQAARQHRP